MIANNDFNRSLSRIFTNPTFKVIAQNGNYGYILNKLKKYEGLLSVTTGMQVKNVIENAYSYLSRNYRNEYVYKNTIANNILMGRHSLNTATMLNEFKVAASIADIVIINGTSTVYEIKTELDSPEKLKKQVEDYKKAFAKIFIVTHHTLLNRYLNLISDDAIGLICLTGRFNFTVVREAKEDFSHIDNKAILKSLRKNEYSSIIKTYFGAVPNVSNIKFFSECLKIFEKIHPRALHDLMLDELKKRKPIEVEILQSKELPRELKHICHCIDPNEKEYTNLFNFLNLNL